VSRREEQHARRLSARAAAQADPSSHFSFLMDDTPLVGGSPLQIPAEQFREAFIALVREGGATSVGSGRPLRAVENVVNQVSKASGLRIRSEKLAKNQHYTPMFSGRPPLLHDAAFDPLAAQMYEHLNSQRGTGPGAAGELRPLGASPAARTAVDAVRSWINRTELAATSGKTRQGPGLTNFEKVTQAITALEESPLCVPGDVGVAELDDLRLAYLARNHDAVERAMQLMPDPDPPKQDYNDLLAEVIGITEVEITRRQMQLNFEAGFFYYDFHMMEPPEELESLLVTGKQVMQRVGSAKEQGWNPERWCSISDPPPNSATSVDKQPGS
jgi:hypothetical protein